MRQPINVHRARHRARVSWRSGVAANITHLEMAVMARRGRSKSGMPLLRSFGRCQRKLSYRAAKVIII